MKTTLLLGAGASVAHAKAERSSAPLPPMDRTFFDVVEADESSQYAGIRAFVEGRWGLTDLRRESMERVFNLIYDAAIEEGVNPGDATRAFRDLKSLYCFRIEESTENLGFQSPDGLSGLLGHLFGLNPDATELTIITFNHDLLAERALIALTPPPNWGNELFDPGNYHCSFKNELTAEPNSSNQELRYAMLGGRVDVLKLHGSLNWLQATTERQETALPVEFGDLYLYLGPRCLSKIEQLWLGRRADGKDAEGYYSEPVVVPPVYEKSRQYARWLEPVWEKAAEALSATERLIVFGYSLPPADSLARKLLGSTLSSHALCGVDVIDIDASVCGKFVALIHGLSPAWWGNVPDFLSGTSGEKRN